MDHLASLLLGLGSGGVFAALALALVITYRASGVVNFATGAIALYVAYTYAGLRKGELLVPFPGLPKTVDLGQELAFVPAVALAMVIAALLGAVLYLLVFRPLRDAPQLAKAVASLGVLVVVQGLLAIRKGTNTVSVAAIFPAERWEIGELIILSDRFYLAVSVVVLALVLAAAYRYTRFGLLTRAAAETQTGAYVSGVSPDRIALVNWMISAMVAGIAGILIAPVNPLTPVTYTLFVVPALAAAVVGKFQHIVPIVAAGLAIGMLQSEALSLAADYSWMPQTGAAELVPLIVILVALVVVGGGIPARGGLNLQRLGRAPAPARSWSPPSPAPSSASSPSSSRRGRGAPRSSARSSPRSSASRSSSSRATPARSPWPSWRWPAPPPSRSAPSPRGGACPSRSLRCWRRWPPRPSGWWWACRPCAPRGLTLGVVTLALAYAIEAVWFRNSDIVPSSGARVTPPSMFGMDLSIGVGQGVPEDRVRPRVPGHIRPRRPRRRRRCAAARSARRCSPSAANERSAAAAGVNVVRVKVLSFALASFIAGLGGSLLAYRRGVVTFDSFTAIGGLALLSTAYLAGVTSVWGGINAGILASTGITFIALDRWVDLGEWFQVISGVLLIVTLITNPEGVAAAGHELADRVDRVAHAPQTGRGGRRGPGGRRRRAGAPRSCRDRRRRCCGRRAGGPGVGGRCRRSSGSTTSRCATAA